MSATRKNLFTGNIARITTFPKEGPVEGAYLRVGHNAPGRDTIWADVLVGPEATKLAVGDWMDFYCTDEGTKDLATGKLSLRAGNRCLLKSRVTERDASGKPTKHTNVGEWVNLGISPKVAVPASDEAEEPAPAPAADEPAPAHEPLAEGEPADLM